MAQSFIIVGAGIIGAMTALELVRAGHRVKVISGGAASATDASFGWINASFYLDDDHHRLRAEGIAAWHRLMAYAPQEVSWRGCLCWDLPAAEMEKTFAQLRAFDYPVERLTQQQIADMTPVLRKPPAQALFFPREGAASSGIVAAHCLRLAQDLGAQIVSDIAVHAIKTHGAQAVGVETSEGTIHADQVIVAAGTGTTALAGSIDYRLPMLARPAYIMRTTRVHPMLDQVLATPVGEIRQEPSGHILMPVVASHQGDSAETLTQTPVDAAEGAMVRLRQTIRGLDDVAWSQINRANRPVPQDGLPAVGPATEGVYLATLHSGITLGPIIAEMIAREVTGRLTNADAAMLAPYRPSRFQSHA